MKIASIFVVIFANIQIAHSIKTTTKGIPERLPNIVFILADDMGYGDVKSYNPHHGNISTPHIDKIGRNGISFMDAHSSSSVCTPSRYTILTGRYNWRSKLKEGVLEGLGRPLISPKRTTIATVLKKAGYKTGIVGKWHVGLNISFRPDHHGRPFWAPSRREWDTIDYSAKIENGPTSMGFDYFYGIAASLDMAPYVYIENDYFKTKGKYQNYKPDYGRQGVMSVAGWDPEKVLTELTQQAKNYLTNNLNINGPPVFLYFSLTSPHTPIRPNEQFKGKSNVGWYGDFVMQTDDVVGQIVQVLTEMKVIDNTLLIFTSDNGFTSAGYNSGPPVSHNLHWPEAHLRGSKADLWEGGHRVPFLLQWPAVVPPNQVDTRTTICQADLYATFAELTNYTLDSHVAEDSFSLLPVLTGRHKDYTRKETVHHSFTGKFAIREGKYVFLLCSGSGGWSSPQDSQMSEPQYQLYDLEADPSQSHNLYDKHKDVAERMKSKLQQIRSSKRTRVVVK